MIDDLRDAAVDKYAKKLKGEEELLLNPNVSHEELINLLNARNELLEAEDAFYSCIREHAKEKGLNSPSLPTQSLF